MPSRIEDYALIGESSKALTYAPTGGLVAAPTTSLPETPGGVRNWDYRYCWIRDATFSLYALMTGGFVDEARAWRAWLLRVVAGHPSDVRIMYGVAGERRLREVELDWLPGYEGASPVYELHVGTFTPEGSFAGVWISGGGRSRPG